MLRNKFLELTLLVSQSLLLAGCGQELQPEPTTAAAMSRSNDTVAAACLSAGDTVYDTAANNHREVWIEAGTYTMGSNHRYREEAPAQQKSVQGFWIDVHEVTNRQFAAFVQQTGYKTTAERTPSATDYPDIPADKLVAGSALFVAPVDFQPGQQQGHWTRWWQFVPGASWKNPQGPGSSIDGLEQHPVVHVSYLDAKSYAQWLGRSLPTEAQWELAAQQVVHSNEDGRELTANTWQGFFPMQDKGLDGFAGTAPVGCYGADGNGLHDMIGNVWEWVSDIYYPGHAPAVPVVDTPVPVRVIKGGSHLCASNYCRRDAPQSRQPQEEDFGVGHVGFRTIRMAGRDGS